MLMALELKPLILDELMPIVFFEVLTLLVKGGDEGIWILILHVLRVLSCFEDLLKGFWVLKLFILSFS